MGNITGALIENAFQPQQSNPQQQPIDVQEEIRKLSRDSSKRELYRLLHAEMEQTTLDRAIASSSHHSSMPTTDAVHSDNKQEVRRTSNVSEEHSLLKNISNSPGASRAASVAAAECNSKDAIRSRNSSVTADFQEDEGNSKCLEQSRSSNEQDAAVETRMAFKKKLLMNYCTETGDTVAREDQPPPVSEANKSNLTGDEAVIKHGAIAKNSSDTRTESVGNSEAKVPMKTLNINSCIEVIVMNELKKMDSFLPSELLSYGRVPYFGLANPEEPKGSQQQEPLNRDERRDNRGSNEPSPTSKDETLIRVGSDIGLNREQKLQQHQQQLLLQQQCHGYPADAAASSQSACLDTTQQYLMAGKMDISRYHGLGGHVPPSFRGESFAPEPGITQSLQRGNLSSMVNESPRNKMMSNQGAGSSREPSVEMPSQYPGQMFKYSPGGLGVRRDVSPAQPLPPHVSHATDIGYRIIPTGGQMQPLQGLDQRRKVDKELEQAKYQRTDYPPLSILSQAPCISGLVDQHVRYQNSPQVFHVGENTNYLYPVKTPRDRNLGPYDLAAQQEASVAGYYKHLQRNFPPISSAYEKEQQLHSRPDLTKLSALANTSVSSLSNYKMLTEPHPSQMYYQNEQAAAAAVGQMDIPSEKRNFQFQRGVEEIDSDRRIKRLMNSNRGGGGGGESRTLPNGSDPSINRSHSVSYPKGMDGLEKGSSAPAEEVPLDLTVKRSFPKSQHAAVYQLPSSSKLHLPEWETGRKAVVYRQGCNDDDQIRAARGGYRPSVPSGPDSDMSEIQNMEAPNIFDKVRGLQVLPPESDTLREMPTSLERPGLARMSVIASHPFEEVQKNPLSHLTMTHYNEAFAKSSTQQQQQQQQQQVGAWKQTAYPESLPRSRAYTLETDVVARLTVETSRPERLRTRQNNDLLPLVTTSPTIPHLSPVQPYASTASLQQSGNRRGPMLNILGSHPPSDILHLQCKICNSTYGSLRSFRMHFAKVHGLEPLPEHCNISTISGTKNAMSRNSIEESEPPPLQRETVVTSDVAASGIPRYPLEMREIEQFGSRSNTDSLRTEVPLASTRTKQVAEVYPMPARVSCGLSPQLKIASQTTSAKHPVLSETRFKPIDTPTKLANDSSSHLINCDMGIFRVRNCYSSNSGCDSDCPECLDGFKDISDCKMHISTHMMRSCTCKACGLSFTHSGALNKHLLTAHSGTEKVDVEYRCLFCREAFSDEKVLFYHTREHEKRYSRLEMAPQDNTIGSMNFKHQGQMNDTDRIQKAVPDTTCTDDVRPTSDFGENSSNVSPGYLPNTETKGIAYERPSARPPGLSKDLIGKKTEMTYAEDKKSLRTNELDSDVKVKMERQNSDHLHNYSWSLESNKSAPDTLKLGLKADMSEPYTDKKMDAKGLTEMANADKSLKQPVASSKYSDDGCAYISRKRALIQRFQSSEDHDSMEKDSSQLLSHSDQMDVASSRTTPSVRSTGIADWNKPDAVQPLCLQDYFTRINEQVEENIRSSSIPELSRIHIPASGSNTTASKPRCVRDVCDEIIAQSFREDNCSREPVASSSLLNALDFNLKVKVNEQLKLLVSPDREDRSNLSASRTVADSCFSQVWSRSPCSSRGSCHSLEIDETEYDKEASDTAEGSTDITYPKRSADAHEDESGHSAESTVVVTSPRQMCSAKDTEEHEKYQSTDKGNGCLGNSNFPEDEDENSKRKESFFSRPLTVSEKSGSECSSVTFKKSSSPIEGSSPSLTVIQNQEVSTARDENVPSTDGGSSLAVQVSCSEESEVTVTKRKRLPDSCKEMPENEPPLKKSAP